MEPIIEPIETDPDEVYLGDGLYARFDGFQIWLRAPREGGDHRVALEPSTFDEFLRFASSIPAAHFPQRKTRSP